MAKKTYTLPELRQKLGVSLHATKKLLYSGWIEHEHAPHGTVEITEEELQKAKGILSSPWMKFRLFFKTLGPGVITGASDDDPSGIATYSSVGAKYGFSLLWMAAWLLPLMLAVQECCARIGLVTNHGLAGVMKKHYSRWLVFIIVLLLIIANVVNIGADIGAMVASLKLLTDVNFVIAIAFFTGFIIAVEILIPYHTYAKILKWLTISIFAYVITGIIIHPDWGMVLKNAFIPHVSWDKEFIFAMVALLGTTITPYLFFWQASEEVEETREHKGEINKSMLPERIKRMRTDVSTGMILANIVFFFIILTTAQVLFRNGITNIDSAEQAALALKPLAGNYAYLLFATGIIGTGLLAVPILAGSGAYALSELMGWSEGLNKKFMRAKAFYLVIGFSILIGLALNFLGINPIKALYYSAFLNGIIAVPLLVVIMLIGNNKKVMGAETHPLWVKFFGWAAVIFMAVAGVTAIVLNVI